MADLGRFITAITASLILAAQAHAHDVAATRVANAIGPAMGACLIAAIVLYAIGVAHVWRRAGVGRGIGMRAAMCFASGCVLLAGAIFSPLDAAAQNNFAIHMVQHELLMVVVAPLLVLGRPLGAWSWAFSMSTRVRIGKTLRAPSLRSAWGALTTPLTAWSLHAIALWGWHAPVLFRAAAADEMLHALQHATFLFTALLFWWAVLGRSSMRSGSALLMLFTTMVHSGALGALLAFSPANWYARDAIGILDEQQLGGLIMWIPGGAVYLLAALAIAYRLLGRAPPTSRCQASQWSGTKLGVAELRDRT